jgi:hypothetical protein
MAYCRWSSDNWRSDVYVYESDQGIAIHVAGMRYVGERPEGSWIKEKDGKLVVDEDFALRSRQWLETADMVAIGGPSDGDTYACDHAEALETLARLRREGYHVPQHVIDEIREELEEMKVD